MTDALQGIEQGLLLDLALQLDGRMLQLAAATQAKELAGRFDPSGRRLQYLHHLGAIEAALAAGLPGHHPLALQGTVDETGLAFTADQALAVQGDVLDGGLERSLVDATHQDSAAGSVPACQACRNSW